MNDAIRETLHGWLVKVADRVLPHVKPDGRVDLPGLTYVHQHVSYALAYLYATGFPGNRYHCSDDALGAALATAGYKFTYQTERGGFDDEDGVEQGDEWSAYFLLRTMEVLAREALGAERWSDWSARLARYVDCHGARAFFYSAPNHECWKCLTIDLAGRLLGRDDCRRLADFQMTQLLRYQLPAGFWDENRHHGPSMSYNFVMAEPLYLYWRATGRADVRAALERLTGFMIRYALPDATTSGALDGRMHARRGRMSAAMSLTPGGRRLNELAWRHWCRTRAEGAEPVGGDFTVEAAWLVDFLRFADPGPARPGEPPAATGRMAPETNGFLAEDHDGNFHALARRQGPWHTVLSGVFSDIPKETDNVFRLERTSRIDLWHERAGLLVGGGSVHRRVERHLANLFLDTGYFAEVDFGRVAGRWPETVRATYYPRLASVSADGERSILELTFAHTQARFVLSPRNQDEFAVEVAIESAGLRRAFAALPLVLWRDAALSIDGRPLGEAPPGQADVARTVRVSRSRLGPGWEVELPAGVRARLNAPFSPVFAHREKGVRDLKEDDVFEVALLAVELDVSGGGRPALPGPLIVRVDR